jgi:hypothetical protein
MTAGVVMENLETLEHRLAFLEQEVAQLKASSGQNSTPESRGARMLRQAEEGHAELIGASKKLLADLGIKGQPIGAKKLREMLLARGFKPEDNSFSREIIAMREE